MEKVEEDWLYSVRPSVVVVCSIMTRFKLCESLRLCVTHTRLRGLIIILYFILYIYFFYYKNGCIWNSNFLEFSWELVSCIQFDHTNCKWLARSMVVFIFACCSICLQLVYKLPCVCVCATNGNTILTDDKKERSTTFRCAPWLLSV